MSAEAVDTPARIALRWPWQRMLWVAVVVVMALAGLWDSRDALLGTPAARAVAVSGPAHARLGRSSGIATSPGNGTLPVLRRHGRRPGGSGAHGAALPTPVVTRQPSAPPIPPVRAVPGIAVARAGSIVTITNNQVSVLLDLAHGRLTLRWPATPQLAATTLADGAATLLLRGTLGSEPGGAIAATDYARHDLATAPFTDALGSGLLITFLHADPRYPPLSQQVRFYRTSPLLVLSATLGMPHGPILDVARLDPLTVDGAAAISVPGNANPLVLAINGLTADHMPRQFAPLDALAADDPLPYLTTIASPFAQGALLAGALREQNWFPSVEVRHGVGGISSLALTNTGPVLGAEVSSEPFMLGRAADGAAALHAYALAAAALTPPPPSAATAQLGWSSWGAFEEQVSQARVLRNADFMAAHLKNLGYSLVHIDDGWQRAYGDWQPGRAFPSGLAALVTAIHARGLRASIWLAPFLTAPNAWPAVQHPDWLLRNVDGSPIQVQVSTPTEVLDASNPQVLAYIQAVCARIRDWGFDAVKLDFLYAGSMEGQRYNFDQNGIQVYNTAMRAIRATLEANPLHPIALTGVQQGFLPIGYFGAWRVGRDIESKTNADHIPTWDLVQREALAVSTFSFAAGILYGADADDLLLRAARGAHNLSADELQSYATMVALGGSVWLSGDDLPTLAAQGRLGYLTNPEVLSVVRAGHAGTPVAYDDQAAGPAPIWNAPQSDGATVVGLFNWGQRPIQISVSTADLGLAAGRSYLVRDLWARVNWGSVTGVLTVSLRPHQSYMVRLAPAR